MNRECDEAKQSRAPTSTMMAFVFLFAPSRFPRLSSCTRRIKTLFPTWRRWPSSTRCLLAARVASMVCRCEEREREREREVMEGEKSESERRKVGEARRRTTAVKGAAEEKRCSSHFLLRKESARESALSRFCVRSLLLV